MTGFAQLANRSLLAVEGADAASFLNGLVTVDTLRLPEGGYRYGLLLSPQGKFLHDFFLLKRPEGFWLDVAADRAEALASRLQAYCLRAKVEIKPLETGVAAAWGTLPADALPDPRLPALGGRLYGAAAGGEAEAYHLHRLSLGVPDTADFIADKSLPLEFGLDALGAVDFDKGCYVGQEVTARTHFRSQLRKGLFIARAEAGLPPPGTPVTTNGQPAGELRTSVGGRGLALLSFEMAEKGGLESQGVALEVSRPVWILSNETNRRVD